MRSRSPSRLKSDFYSDAALPLVGPQNRAERTLGRRLNRAESGHREMLGPA